VKDKKRYQKPELRKVRLNARTSVLATCNTSGDITPAEIGPGGRPCNLTFCNVP
jgi:hypothetical protein